MKKGVEIKMSALPLSIIVDGDTKVIATEGHPQYMVDGQGVSSEVFATILLMRQVDITFAVHARLRQLLAHLKVKLDDAVPEPAPAAPAPGE